MNPLVPIPCHTWKVKGVPPRTSWDCWYTWTEKLLVWTKADNIRRERRVRQCYRCHSTRRKTRLIIVLLTSGIATNSCNRRCKLVLIIRVSRNGLDISSISYRITGSKTNRGSTWCYQVGKVIRSIHVKMARAPTICMKHCILLYVIHRESQKLSQVAVLGCSSYTDPFSLMFFTYSANFHHVTRVCERSVLECNSSIKAMRNWLKRSYRGRCMSDEIKLARKL